MARAKSFQVGNSNSHRKERGGDDNWRARGEGHNWRSEKLGSPPSSTNSKTNTWRRDLTGLTNNKAADERRSSSPSSTTNTWRREANNNKTEEMRREADLARMKEEIVREVREEASFTF